MTSVCETNVHLPRKRESSVFAPLSTLPAVSSPRGGQFWQAVPAAVILFPYYRKGPRLYLTDRFTHSSTRESFKQIRRECHSQNYFPNRIPTWDSGFSQGLYFHVLSSDISRRWFRNLRSLRLWCDFSHGGRPDGGRDSTWEVLSPR